jgi:hypothetical protein
MTRVEWNLSDGAPLSCRRRARLEKIGCIGRRFLLAMWRGWYFPSYRQRPHSDTETQRPSAVCTRSDASVPDGYEVEDRGADGHDGGHPLHGTIMLLVEDLLQ